jgi:hypothetical protein
LFGNCWPAWGRFFHKAVPPGAARKNIAVKIGSISSQRSLELVATAKVGYDSLA